MLSNRQITLAHTTTRSSATLHTELPMSPIQTDEQIFKSPIGFFESRHYYQRVLLSQALWRVVTMRNGVFIELQNKLAGDPDRVICTRGPESGFRQITAGITRREGWEGCHLHFNWSGLRLDIFFLWCFLGSSHLTPEVSTLWSVIHSTSQVLVQSQ